MVIWIRSNEGLTLETSVAESRYGDQFTLSTQLIKPNYLVILPTDAAPQFLEKRALFIYGHTCWREVHIEKNFAQSPTRGRGPFKGQRQSFF